MKALSNDDSLDTAWGTAVEVTDTNTASGDLLITDPSSSITIGNTPVGGDQLFVRLYRNVSDASDTWGGEARFIQLQIFYPIDALSAGN
jgi:hypothetical protein